MKTILTTFAGLVGCLVGLGLVAIPAPAGGDEISWQATSRMTDFDGVHYTREGTAIFSTEENAAVLLKGTLDPRSDAYKGTAVADITYRFEDGSTIALQTVWIWNPRFQAGAGIFTEGSGRFWGITGVATSTATVPTAGTTVNLWRASYELPPMGRQMPGQ